MIKEALINFTDGTVQTIKDVKDEIGLDEMGVVVVQQKESTTFFNIKHIKSFEVIHEPIDSSSKKGTTGKVVQIRGE